MRKLALLIAVLCLLTLATLLLYLRPLNVTSQEQLLDLEDNQLVMISGKVISEKPYYGKKAITLDNNIEFYCECSLLKLIDKNIVITARIDTFEKSRLKVLRIEYDN